MNLRKFIDIILRGIGQVFFQNNPLTGLLFLIGIAINSWQMALYALLGTIVSTFAAMFLGASEDLLEAGIFGFNGTLVGLGIAVFIINGPISVIYLIIGSILSTIIMAALTNYLGKWDMPALTAPFVFTTWILLLGVYSFSNINPTLALNNASLPIHQSEVFIFTTSDLLKGLLNGIAQVDFQANLLTGIIFIIAIGINSKTSAAFAVIGSLIGWLTAGMLGGATDLAALGIYGFNPVLTGIALGGIFFTVHRYSIIYALFGMVITVIMQGAIASLLSPVGIPVLTFPFILTTWIFLFGKSILKRITQVSPK